MSVVEADIFAKIPEKDTGRINLVRHGESVRRMTDVGSTNLPIDLRSLVQFWPVVEIIQDGLGAIPVGISVSVREPIELRLADLNQWNSVFPAIVEINRLGNGELDSFILSDQLLNFIRMRPGSTPVLELVYSKGGILNTDRNTSFGYEVALLLQPDEQAESIIGFESPSQSILAGLEITEGVRERFEMFKDQAELMLLYHMNRRLLTGDRDPIQGIDFGAGSLRYVSEALQSIFTKYPYLRGIFGYGAADIDQSVFEMYPEMRNSYLQDTQKIPLKFYAIDADPVATRFCGALSDELGVSEYIVPINVPFRQLININSLFRGENIIGLKDNSLFDIITSSGLDDYYKLSLRRNWFSQLYTKLKPGKGITYIASIGEFPEMVGTDGNGIGTTEPELLTTLFNWGEMYADTPISAVGQYRDAGWKPGEIKFVEISPNNRFFAVVTQRGME
ncbi:MAG: hypothetical protein M3Q44_07960 [bacterium]|nr:hypothetical protein [bacterium]